MGGRGDCRVALVNMAVAHAVFCRFVVRPVRALLQDARFTQKTMQWQHYDLFAQLVGSSALSRRDMSEYGLNLRLMTVPWQVVRRAQKAGEPAVALMPECAALFFPQAEENGVPLVAFTSAELHALVGFVRRSHDWQDSPEMNVRVLNEIVQCAHCEREAVKETLCFYLALMCDDVRYTVLLRTR